MALNRFQPWLLVLILQLLVISAARAQESDSAGVPAFAPGIFEDSDFQFFSQPDLSSYGSGNQPPHGWFGNVDYLIWGVSAPQATSVGADHIRQVFTNNGSPGQSNGATPTLPTINANGTPNYAGSGDLFTTESNSDTTGFTRMGFHSGARIDLGYIDDDTNTGWLFSGFRLASVTQSTNTANANMVLDDGSSTDTPGVNIQPASVYNGIPGGPTALPLLYGWVDRTGGGAAGTLPDGYVDDVNHNNLYGPQGRDRGVVSGNVLSTGTTLSGKPANEGGADTLTTGGPGFTPTGPSPGQPASGVYQPIDYGDAVPLPVVFSSLKLQYTNWAYGAEASRLWRLGEGHYGGTWEVFGGVRYLDYGDYFGGYGTGGILANSYWGATTENHIGGGQLGLRWRKKWNRMGLALEARGTAGANFQNSHMSGLIGSELTMIQPNPTTVYTTVTIPTAQVTPAPTTTNQLVIVTTQPNNPGGGPTAFRVNQPMNLNPTGFNISQHKVTFSPIGELRANWSYQLFNQVSLTAGWTGIFVNGVGQASRQIDYAVPAFTFLQGAGLHQTVVLTGLNIGIQFNR
ncbi:MAG TPA: hypothetical protein VIK18_18315 [Pirellulales bacterium]